MKEAFVSINNVSKYFNGSKIPALDSINTIIPKGEIVGLVGPDGAGKTTLIRLIAGLLIPTSGKITVGGFDTVTDQSELSNLIGYMPQKFGLYEDLTVKQNLNLYADLQGVTGIDRKNVFEKLLNFTRLGPFTSRLAGALSGGMKQKLGLACTLIRNPALLLLDEPSVGVDPLSRRELWTMVQNLIDEGISVVWSTSYLDEAEKCETVLLLNNGKLLCDESSKSMCERVQGRTYLICNIKDDRRQVLEKALLQKNVIDSTIQGRDVRIVLKEKNETIDLADLSTSEKLELKACPPRFEDAFVDILGGTPKEVSSLALRMPMNTTKEVLVEAHGLTKRFGSFTAASNITFNIESGEIFGLLGPNGAGKSTTFKMMCGLLKPTSGEGFVNGVDLQKAPGEARSHIGYMAQKFSLYGNLSVKQNLNFFSGAYNLIGQRRRDAVDEMIEIFNFAPLLDQSADALPLGFKQRLALSCAVMHQPRVLFLDEPTSGVDPITRREFWSHINGLVQRGMTVMVTTHFMDEAEYCDRIALIYQSKVITLGTPDALKEKAKTAENPSPTLEDAFIGLIEQYDSDKNAKESTA